MARLHVLDVDPRIARRWAVGRAVGILGFAVLLTALVFAPQPALTMLWSVAVPLLPASFFISPAFWRGVCPLSSLNAWGNRFGPAREMTAREASAIGVAGLILFHLLVPARHLGLNTDGPVLAGALAAIALIAVASGARYASRSAFCNALCPVLPVERLYGQAPLVEVARGRCESCTVCTPRGCIDLADRKAMRQLLGAPRLGGQWLQTPFGIFAAALPGFIVGYGLVPDAGFGEAPSVYAATLGGAMASYVVVRALVSATRSTPVRAIAWCGALSGGLYYWYAAPVLTRNLGLIDVAVPAIRAVAIGAISAWLLRTLARDRAAAVEQ